jgi:response regulator RpfG family c-di-GMP phosphodiesterase
MKKENILRVLLIEDNEDDAELVLRQLRGANGYSLIHRTVQSEAALSIAFDETRWDVVICDYKLPHLSPYKALEIVKQISFDIPFIIFSGSVHEDIAIDLLKQGASDFVSKDNLARLPLVITRELRQASERIQRTLDVVKAYDKMMEAWGVSLEMRDVHTSGHTVRVTDLTLRLARLMQVSKHQFQNIYRGALLHDIGKIAIPDMVLLKEGPLTPEERGIMEMHPVIAYERLKGIPFLEGAIHIPYCHHEKWDGTGYPRRLYENKIPFEARLFSVADVYDALTSDRPYRKSWSVDKALEYIKEQKGMYFDPAIADNFIRMMRTI